MVDSLDCALAFKLAELRTITLVMGNPPNKPEVMFPIPCATNSLLVEVTRFCGSSLSTASIHKSVSIEATAASVKATKYTCGLVICEKSGKVKKPQKSDKEAATGTFTK